MTNEELADALDGLADIGSGKSELRDNIREAAQLIRAMPEGERIEGIIVEESRDFKTEKLWRIVFEQRDPDMADPVRYARATLIIHTRKEGER